MTSTNELLPRGTVTNPLGEATRTPVIVAARQHAEVFACRVRARSLPFGSNHCSCPIMCVGAKLRYPQVRRADPLQRLSATFSSQYMRTSVPASPSMVALWYVDPAGLVLRITDEGRMSPSALGPR